MLTQSKIEELIRLQKIWRNTCKTEYWRNILALEIDWMVRESTGEVFVKADDVLALLTSLANEKKVEP